MLLLNGFIEVLNPLVLIWLFIGTFAGIMIGAMPGLTATMGIALLVPITFSMPPLPSIGMLLGIYCGGMYGGSLTAILINTPGTPAAAATAMDGYELNKQGRGTDALKMAIFSSVIGGLISAVILSTIAPLMASLALKFGPPEYFAVITLGLTIVCGVSGKSLIKGLLIGCLGLIFSCVGYDPIQGLPRMDFGNYNLSGGLNLIAVLIGLFALSEVLVQSERIGKSRHTSSLEPHSIDAKETSISIREMTRYLGTITKGGLIGTFIGAIPGIGGGVAAFMSYNEAKRVSKNPEKFGKGELAGVAASESANNGVTGATLIPLLTLSIPGDVCTAVLLGAFMIQDLTPGPLLFEKHGPVVFAIFASLFIVNIIMLVIAWFGSSYFAKVSKVPNYLLYPVIIILCAVGTYVINSNFFEIATMLFFGIIGYVIRKLDMPIGPFLIAFILGPLFESNLRRTMILFDNNLALVYTRPISVVFFILAALSLFFILRNQSQINKLEG